MKVCIVGGGIAGLFSALVIKKQSPDVEVTIIEGDSKVGGLLTNLDLNGIPFDTGVHTFYETGSRELDDLFFSIVPKGGWKKLSGLKRDVGGIFQNRKLNVGNSYINFLDLEPNVLKQIQNEFLVHFNEGVEIPEMSAFDHLSNKFGPSIVNQWLNEFIKKFTGYDAKFVSSAACSILPLGRINLFPYDSHVERIDDVKWNSRISFPNQRDLPNNLIPVRSAYYPTNYGTQLYIDAIFSELRSFGVNFYLENKVRGINNSKLYTENGAIVPFDLCLWASHPVGLARVFGNHPAPQTGLEPVPMNTAVVSYLVKEKPQLEDLYYAYDATPFNISHRFSSPVNFCENSRIGRNYRFTNEVVYHSNMSESKLLQISTRELVSHGVLKESDILVGAASKIIGGYPNLNLESANSMEVFLTSSMEKIPSNVVPIGIMSKKGLFFQNDILLNAFNLIRELKIS